jgi:hypothetical protein
MKRTEIKQGKWYETKQGTGECTSTGGNFPWSAQINVTHPIPRGRVNVEPRDVLREVDAPKSPTSEAKTGEVSSAPPKPSVLKTVTPERKHGPHGPNCHCPENDANLIRLSVEFDALVPDEAAGKKIAEMFAAIANIIRATGIQTQFQAGLYERGEKKAEAEMPPMREQTPRAMDPNLN